MAKKGKKVNVPTGDAEKGEQLFNKECSVCHSSVECDDKNNAAPHLGGIINRKSGSTNFPFSNAMKKAKKTWKKEEIFQYLEAPAKFIPGNKMSYGGIKDAQKRGDLIAFLETL